MSKFKKWLGKTVVAATVGVVSLQASASAAPLDDLNAILEKQAQAEAPSPISTMLDWDNIVKAMNEGGAQVSINARSRKNCWQMQNCRNSYREILG